MEKLLPRDLIEEHRHKQAGALKLKEKVPPKASENRIKVKCLNDNILLRVGKCCNPVPGDPIVGYITRGRGITVHHMDCPSASHLDYDSERFIEVEWGTGPQKTHMVRVSIVTEDRPGQLANISRVLAACDINITRANLHQGPHQRAYFDLYIEIKDLEHLNKTLDEVRKVDGVIHLERVKEHKQKILGKNRLAGSDGNLNSPRDRELLVN